MMKLSPIAEAINDLCHELTPPPTPVNWMVDDWMTVDPIDWGALAPPPGAAPWGGAPHPWGGIQGTWVRIGGNPPTIVSRSELEDLPKVFPDGAVHVLDGQQVQIWAGELQQLHDLERAQNKALTDRIFLDLEKARDVIDAHCGLPSQPFKMTLVEFQRFRDACAPMLRPCPPMPGMLYPSFNCIDIEIVSIDPMKMYR